MSQNVKIIFYPFRLEGSVQKGITILEAAKRLGLNIESPCGGTGKCGKDLVQIRTNKTLNAVLACNTLVETDMEVFIPSYEKEKVKIVEDFYVKDVGINHVNPVFKKTLVYGNNSACLTNVYANGKFICVEDGDTTLQNYGVAVDIGTTTLAAALVNLSTGNVLERRSMLNPLIHYGHDVMSRIKYSTTRPDGLSIMQKELISAINLLIEVLSIRAEINRKNIYQVTAAGNTTMQHIFLNKKIEGIGEYPYKAEVLDAVTAQAAALGINIAACAQAVTFPCISAYIGGDIVSGILAIDFENLKLPAIFLDIGTNGELVLLHESGRAMATSTAAGPCFEGMTISSGMRASEGAVEHVNFENESPFTVIDGGNIRGICGSGLLDLVSESVRTGLVNSSGRLQSKECEIPAKYKKYLSEKDGKRCIRLTDNVSILQDDVRQVQLAKAAIRAGVNMLLSSCNVKPEELKTVIIAGSFGYHIEKKSLFGIGIFPKTINAEFRFVGNSSLGGALKLLINKDLINKANNIVNMTKVLELSQIPDFEDVFVKEMRFY